MVMKAVVIMSVVTTVLLVLLQKQYPGNELNLWLTSSGKESYERTNKSVSRSSRYERLSTKYPARTKEMIKSAQGHMLEVTSSHAGESIECMLAHMYSK